MHEAPHAPWALRGEIVVGVARGPGPGGSWPLPEAADGLRPARGPALVLGVRYTESPVGPYLELGVLRPVRLGLRPGLCHTTLVVSDAAAKVGCRLNWGLPAELGRLTWAAEGDLRVVRWEDRGIELRAQAVGPRLPVVVPTRGVQRRGDGPVLVPRRVAGLLRYARAVVMVADDDELAWAAGTHPGATVAAARLMLHPARHPTGVLSSFRAPLREVEPGLSYRAARPKATAEALQ